MLPLALALALLAAPQSPTAAAAGNETLRDALQERLDAFVAAGRVPGVSAGVALVDGQALALAAGIRERGQAPTLEPGDRMLAGSTGKTFVAAVALGLVAEGELDLDERVAERLGGEPWFERLPNADGLTLRHLLSHRSGLERYEFKPAFARDLVADPDRVWRPADLLGYVLGDEPLFAPGEGFAYSDTNYILVGLLVEHVGATTLRADIGHTLYGEVHRRLLEPLELTGVVPAVSRTVPGLVQGHAGEHDPLGLPDRVIDAEGRFCINPQFEWAGGGFATTGGDLARWARALYAGNVLDEDMRAAMLDAQDAPELGRGVRYGLGAIVWNTEHGPAWGHSGFFPGYLTEVRFWPDHGVAVAVQVNTSDFRAVPRPLGALCEELLATTLTARER
jgi:D-alanyl-D-alanine carboxypeptidase